MAERSDINELLRELGRGDRRDALDRLMPVVYEELRRIAHAQLRREREGSTLNTTGLVHEAYLKLVDIDRIQWRDRIHFFAMAARLMRRVLIDYARARGRQKRGGEIVHVTISESLELPAAEADELEALDEALDRLERLSERQCRVVECRCFSGLSVEETAAALGISPATVKRDWTFARAWLNRELQHMRGFNGFGRGSILA